MQFTRVVVAAVALLSAVASPAPALAQAPAPAGGEFRVHASTLGIQDNPDVFQRADGSFVVVWSDSISDGSTFGVRGQRYDRAGTAVGAAFQVNTYTTGSQRLYSAARNIAAAADGRFVVAWESSGQDGDGDGVFAQRYDADAAPLGAEFRVNGYTTGDQTGVSLGMAADGGFVVVWHSMGQDGDLLGVFGRRYGADGAALGAEFQVNEFTTSGQLAPDVAVRADGSFLVAWMSAQDGSSNSVHARRYDPAGAALGPEFLVNTTTAFGQTFPVVAATPAGFVIAWESDLQDGSSDGIFAQRFDAAGVRVGGEFQVNTYTTSRQAFPAIAADATGRFAVTWDSLGADADLFAVSGQRFDADGTRRGDEFRVNTATTGNQMSPRIASDPSGNLIAVWESPDGSGQGSFAQRYGGLRPAALALDTLGNNVLEPGETGSVRSSWRNDSGAAITFGGTLASLAGPAGVTAAITDGVASYGTVAGGAAAACTDCYAVQVDPVATRPQAHIDLSAVETITPEEQGQTKVWTLHVGDSFADMPRNNGAYRFVETILHQGVTTGCTPTLYCAGLAVTRAQMPVFVLASNEPGTAPPACGVPIFADVPATSPFCRWIEELARRGVVAGCGGGNYCPDEPVTREQMPVFILRVLDPTLDPPPCVPPNMFPDVPETSPFCRWIEEFARGGISGGCGFGNYCPHASVTRDQMAVFLTVAFGLTLYGP